MSTVLEGGAKIFPVVFVIGGTREVSEAKAGDLFGALESARGRGYGRCASKVFIFEPGADPEAAEPIGEAEMDYSEADA